MVDAMEEVAKLANNYGVEPSLFYMNGFRYEKTADGWIKTLFDESGEAIL
jgi:hypothetical protein